MTNLNFNRKYAGFGIHYHRFDKGFHNTELGFLQSRVNKQDGNGNLFLSQPDPHGIIRSVFTNTYTGHDWTTEGLNLAHTFGIFANVRFTDFSNIFINRNHNLAHYDDLEWRGGPPCARAGGYSFAMGYGMPSRKQLGGAIRLEAWHAGN